MVKIFCQVLGTNTMDSDPSVLLFFDNKRYMFNVGEGTTRFCTEHKIRLAKVSHLFLTDLSPETLGGLPGMLLTLADTRAGITSSTTDSSGGLATMMTNPNSTVINLYGPSNTLFYLSTLRWFVKRRDLFVALTEAKEEAEEEKEAESFIFSDENLRVESVVVVDQSSSNNASLLNDYLSKYEQLFKQSSNHSPLLHGFESSSIKTTNTTLVTKTNESKNNSDDNEKGENNENEQPETKRRKLDDGSSDHHSNNDNNYKGTNTLPIIFSYRDRLNLLLDEKRTEKIYGTSLKKPNELLPRPFDSCVSYICHTPLLPGKFDAKKAKALGIKPGPLYGQLSRGELVTLDDGRVITPDQVVGQARPGPIVAIISCPSQSLVNALVNHKKWIPYHTNKQKISVMIHMAKNEIINDPNYVSFMKKFGKDCQHLLINKTHSPDKCVFESFANIQCKLNLIDNEIFGIPQLSESNDVVGTHRDESPKNPDMAYQPKSVTELEAKLGKGYRVWKTDNMMKFTLEPQAQFGIDTATAVVPNTNPSTVQSNFSKETHPTLHALVDQYKLAKSNIMNRFKSQPENSHEVTIASMNDSDKSEIVFFGTGSALPSKYRNVSSILFKSPHHTTLMDCGEGTLGQMYRVYGEKETNDLLMNQMKCIWISHMHADHHLGLAKILRRRCNLYLASEQKEPLRKLIVVGPYILLQYLLEYEIACHKIQHPNAPKLSDSYEFVLVDKLLNSNHSEPLVVNTLYASHGESDLQMTHFYNVAVDHSCRHSYGLIMQFSNGIKIVYSGDTRPCQQLIEAGMNATVLIHEATFEDTLQDEAIKKKHSTTKEAVTSGMQMNAYRIMLTHFSQRYPKVPVFDDEDMKGSATNRSCIAFDMMRVSLNSLPYAPAIIPSVQELFAEEISEQQ